MDQPAAVIPAKAGIHLTYASGIVQVETVQWVRAFAGKTSAGGLAETLPTNTQEFSREQEI
jgi:hypothetical protein